MKYYEFKNVSISFTADPERNAELIQEYTEYNRLAGEWERSKGKLRPQVMERDGRCMICGSTENLVVDHIIPMRRGGKNELSNLRTLCQTCNSSKASKDRVYSRVRKQAK